jgi:hypothetical protein
MQKVAALACVPSWSVLQSPLAVSRSSPAKQSLRPTGDELGRANNGHRASDQIALYLVAFEVTKNL